MAATLPIRFFRPLLRRQFFDGRRAQALGLRPEITPMSPHGGARYRYHISGSIVRSTEDYLIHALGSAAQRTLNLPVGIAFGQILPLVVVLFTARET